jgi:hypothetical protein
VAPSLRDLTLKAITLRDCPCDTEDRWYRYIGLERLHAHADKHQWYDVAIMLNKVLNLEKCLIINWHRSRFVRKVSNLRSRPEAEIITILRATGNILGKYVLESKGESPALWLLNKQATKEPFEQHPLHRKRKATEIDLD